MLGRILLILILLLICGCGAKQFDLPSQSKSFSQNVTYNNKVDIILMVDNSSSMVQYQDKFAEQVPNMVTSLNKLSMDYHIAIVSSDMRDGMGSGGKFIGNPSFLTSKTSNLTTLLAQRVKLGQLGSDLERGIDSVKAVLDADYLSSEGRGFLRPEAYLATIYLTNEDDWGLTKVDDMIAFMDVVKPKLADGRRGWISNFIGVTSVNGNCATNPDLKEPGLKYMQLSDASGGLKESICLSGLGKAVENVKIRIVQILSDFKLGRKPIETSLKVFVNGKEVPNGNVNGWQYIPEGYIIRFYGEAIPGAFDTISVDFKPADAT